MIIKKDYTFQLNQINVKDIDKITKHQDYISNVKPVKPPIIKTRDNKQLDIVKLPKSSSAHKIHYINYPKLGLNLS